MGRRYVLALLLSVLTITAAGGADAGSRIGGEWPQWRGPGRDSAAASFEIPATWPPALREVWAVEVGPHPVALDRHLLVKDGTHVRLWAIAAD
jgi:hypothetical protein